MTKIIPLTLIIIALLAPPVFAGGGFAEHEKNVMRSFRAGDYHGIFRDAAKLLEAHPLEPESFMYYGDFARLTDVIGPEKTAPVIRGLLERLEREGPAEGRGIARITLLMELEKILKGRDRPAEVEIGKSLSPIRRWTILGPYSLYGPGDLYQPFPPELMVSLKASKLPSRNILLDSPDGTLRCERYLYPAQGIAYAVTSFGIRQAVKIRVYSRTRYSLFINGKQVLKNNEDDVMRRCRVLRVWGADDLTLMVKLYKKESWDVRIVVTDVNDHILAVREEPPRMSFSEFRHSEELDHPFGHYMAIENPVRKNFALANFFDELDSEESIKFYRKAWEHGKDPVLLFFYASALGAYGGSDAASARNLEGDRLMAEAARLDPELAPAMHRVFRKIYDTRDYLKALRYGSDRYGKLSRYFPFRRDFARLMRILGYRREFLVEIKKLREDFPESTFALQEEAAYYKSEDPDRALALYGELLKKKYDKKILTRMLSIYGKRSERKEALTALDRYDPDRRLDRKRITLLADSGDFEKAKDLAFKKLTLREDPWYYFALGDIDQRMGMDPLMNWKRYLELEPSSHGVSDYVWYLEKGDTRALPGDLHRTAAASAVDEWKKLSPEGRGFSGVLFSGRAFTLNTDGGSRVFCHDVVALGDLRSVEKWGEYRIPYRGTFTPMRVRVYHPGGGFTDTYSTQAVDGVTYINMPSLKEGSLFHVSYRIDNPVTEPSLSRFFSIPFTRIGDFSEPLRRFSFTLVAPKNMKVDVLTHEGARLKEEESENSRLYSFEVTDMPALSAERFMGDSFNILPFYAFSTMKGPDDLAAWYRGRLKGLSDADAEFCRDRFTGRGRALIESVYDFTAREIDLAGSYLYYPPKASDVLYRKRGTVEGRVILARSILERLGIISSIALARRMDFPETGSFVSPDVFTDILLYVPLSPESGVWMDFSGMDYGCGTVRDDLEGVEALVLVGDGIEMKRVESIAENAERGKFAIDMAADGSARPGGGHGILGDPG